MATVYKRGRNWWISYSVHGKRVSKSLKVSRKSDAFKHKALIEARLIEQPAALAQRDTLVDLFWPKYLEWMQAHRRPNTITIKAHFWRRLIAFSGARRLGDVTCKTIEAFKAHMKDGGAADTSVNNALKDIQSTYNWAVRQGYFSGPNPCAGVERYELTRTIPKYHTAEERDRLIECAAAIDQQTEWVVLLGAFAGLRKGEILNCRWEWLDFEKRVISVRRHAGFEIKDREERTVPMHSRIRTAMAPHAKDAGHVFESGRKSEGRHRYHYDPKRSLLTALRDAGLTTRDPFQRLRETFGSLHAQKGTSIFKVSRWLGHASVKTTERHYAALTQQYDPDIE